MFTKCKDSLQDGRRLENLSWRLWFDSGRQEAKLHRGEAVAHNEEASGPPTRFHEAGWSDPEWTETTDSESDEDNNAPSARSGRHESRRSSSSTGPTLADPENRSASLAPLRPSLSTRGTSGGPFDRRSTSTLTGGSLQRMITGLTTLPALPTLTLSKARSCVDVPAPTQPISDPRLPIRGASAPDVNLAPLLSPPKRAAAVAARPSPPTPKPSVVAPATRPSPTILQSPQFSRQISSGARSNSSRSMTRSGSGSGAATPTPTPTKKSATKAGPAPAPRPLPRPVGNALAGLRNDSQTQLTRNFSTASFEPKSLVKGFDTTAFDNRPKVGAIAPPPTPAPAPALELSESPPAPSSALKSTARPSTGKKIFFISSPTSDSDEEGSPSRDHPHRHPHQHTKLSPKASTSSHPPAKQAPPPATTRLPPQGRPPPVDEDEWDDEDEEGSEDEEDDDASSGWGSEYSTESEEPGGRTKTQRSPAALFAKRPAVTATTSELKPRPAGLLSQLFHPGLMEEDDRRHSAVDVTRRPKGLSALHTSRSAGVLTEQHRSKSFLRGAPAGTEMESSSEEEDGGDDDDDDDDDYEDATSSDDPHSSMAAALARHQRQQLEAAGPIAPPQTPRTTRRAMLATELSESLRRNLLWERQTRNRILGGPVDPRFRPAPQQPPLGNQTASANLLARPADSGLLAPHPSPATRDSSPVAPMVRRHTTGTGLYLQAQQEGRLSQARRPSPTSSESTLEEDEPPEPTRVVPDVYGSAFTHGLHHHGSSPLFSFPALLFLGTLR